MTSRLRVLPVLIPLAALHPQGPGVEWSQVEAAGRGGFEEDWHPGQWPMGVQPMVAATGLLLMIGTRQVWTSTDGVSFARLATIPGPQRLGAAAVLHDGRIWQAGGEVDGRFVTVVRSSADLQRWRIHGEAPWPGRRGASLVSWRGWLWLLGGVGVEPYRDIWRTRDGNAWERVRDRSPWSASDQPVVVVHHDSLFAFAGASWHSTRAELWVSGDGEHWSRLVPDAPWGARVYAGYLSFGGALWIMGGVTPEGIRRNDVWRSCGGQRWELVSGAAPWSRRAGNRTVVWRNAVWLFGGKGKEAGGKGGYAGDIWRMTLR